MEPITSRSNPKIKGARALRSRKSRREQNAFLVEGIRHVGEAVDAGAALQSIFYAPELLDSPFAQNLVERQSAAGIPCYATTRQVFTSLAEKENPQGIIAVVRKPTTELGELSPGNLPWGVALVAPGDPGNLGAILRTLDAVGASGLILLNSSVDPHHPSAVRASMGTIFWIPVVEAAFENFEIWRRKHGYHLYGTSAHAETDYKGVDYQSPCILLLGSERQGLTKEQANTCDYMVRLPMYGRATSLNLAVAAGILLYSMLAKLSAPK